MSRRLMYAYHPLERAGISRRDDAWLADRLTGDVRVVPVSGLRSLIAMDDPPVAVMLTNDHARQTMAIAREISVLGTRDDITFIAAAVDEAAESDIGAWAGRGEFIDLRQTGRFMDREQASLLAHARGLVYWHSRHMHCGVCGYPTESRGAGHVRRCANTDCATDHFPRTDPAVIMLVYRDDIPGGACLLGRQAGWPVGMYSTLAGFVEPGESLEQTVAREVFEESGIEVDEVTYLASQPWPFPASLMLGFHARAASTEILVDHDELDDAQWFRRDDVRNFAEWDDAVGDQPRLPRRDSISRWLVEQWLASGS